MFPKTIIFYFLIKQVTEENVNYIINNLNTWLIEDAVWQFENNRYFMSLSVKNDENLDLRFIGAKTHLSTATPRFSYLFNSVKIRAIDFHYSYPDFEGNRRDGWHEHKWSDTKGDKYRFPLPEFEHLFNNANEEQQINYILKRWNIQPNIGLFN